MFLKRVRIIGDSPQHATVPRRVSTRMFHRPRQPSRMTPEQPSRPQPNPPRRDADLQAIRPAVLTVQVRFETCWFVRLMVLATTLLTTNVAMAKPPRFVAKLTDGRTIEGNRYKSEWEDK